jgi:hypothetical protein
MLDRYNNNHVYILIDKSHNFASRDAIWQAWTNKLNCYRYDAIIYELKLPPNDHGRTSTTASALHSIQLRISKISKASNHSHAFAIVFPTPSRCDIRFVE